MNIELIQKILISEPSSLNQSINNFILLRPSKNVKLKRRLAKRLQSMRWLVFMWRKWACHQKRSSDNGFCANRNLKCGLGYRKLRNFFEISILFSR
jgi:hypothetical protein